MIATATLPERTRAFLEHGAPEGRRAEEAFAAAVQLRDAGYSEAEALTEILKGAASCAFPEKEARDAVRSAFGRSPREPIHSKGNGSTPPKADRKEAAVYSYTDERGKLLFQAVRYTPKGFAQRQPDGKSGWIWNLQGVRRVPYRLPQVVKATEVWIVEGEKDADTLTAQGFTATTNPCGACKWLPDYNQHFTGKAVIICGDNDAKGKEHVAQVAKALHGTAASVRVVELPAEVKDVSDFVPTFQDRHEAARILREKAEHAPEWKPPQAADIKGGIVAILTDGNLTASQCNDGVASLVVEALTEQGQFYFHSERRDFATAMYFDRRTKRLECVQSDSFVAWLSEWTGVNRSAHVFKFVLSAVETAALSGPKTSGIVPESFWASRPGAFYLSNGDGQLVKITSAGVELADNGTDNVLFGAGATLKPWVLTEPVDPFKTCALFRDASYGAQHAAQLVKIWVVSLPTSPVCKPPLALTGEIGSGKTAEARGFSELYGLDFAAAKVERDGERDFWSGVNAGGIYCADNADTKTEWFADCVANAATGGCSVRRKLYTDAEKDTQRARAWVVITSATPTFGNDAGIADRLLVVRLRRRTGNTADAALYGEIASKRNGALSWIANTLAAALADTGETLPGLNSRHPDFAGFAVKIGRALSQENETIAALRAAESDKSRFCLENDTLGAALLALLADGKAFTGTAAELLEVLSSYDADFSEDATGPRGNRLWTSKRVGKRLSTLWPHVEAVADASKGEDRNHFTVYAIKPRATADFADFETLKRIKSSRKEHIETLPDSAKETPQTPQLACDLIDSADIEAHRAFALRGARP